MSGRLLLNTGLTRKRKVDRVAKDPRPSQKWKSAEELVDPNVNRPLSGGMWDPDFTLSHKIDFNFDVVKQKVMASTGEQKMAENCLEFLL